MAQPQNDVVGLRDDESDPVVEVRSYDGEPSLSFQDIVREYVIVIAQDLAAIDAAW